MPTLRSLRQAIVKLPAGATIANVNVNERTVGVGRVVFAKSAPCLWTVEQTVKHLGIALVAASIAVEVVHPAVVVFIDEDVRGGAERMPAVRHIAERAGCRRACDNRS